jgi:hypothetical protein
VRVPEREIAGRVAGDMLRDAVNDELRHRTGSHQRLRLRWREGRRTTLELDELTVDANGSPQEVHPIDRETQNVSLP